ncbi:MAG: hypothetical protein A2W31_03965 [Planctomycetes bacterium RBG_16_64_10]|nr:MAG: hypothetical protein A2W31_03965 [Planctomycetes bacterium RBG_16_64_10]
MELARFKVLSDQEIRAIHDATVDLLADCGVQVLSPRMRTFLRERGLRVDEQSQTVRFSRTCLEDSLSTIPPQFDVFDRNGALAFVLGDRQPKIAAGHNAVFWVDSETGRTRPSTVADVELFARICQVLECIDMIGVPVMPQDVPDPQATLLYGLRAVIENSTKPIFFSTDNRRANRACIELLRAAFAGNLASQVYGISQLSSTSPLYWEEGVLEALADTVQCGVPVAILPEPIAGFTAPYTLAALLTMNNAECLSGLAMTQLLRPAARVLYANSWTTFDMRSGVALVGSAETSVCRIAGAQLADFYHVPCHTTAPNSDNHDHDEQNAWEKTLSLLCAIGAGNDLIVNCGMFATGMTFSHEQLLMDEAIAALARRIAAGLTVNQDTIAADVIRQVGPHGEQYLTHEHTLRWLRSGEYVAARESVVGPRAWWEAQGAKNTYQLAQERTRGYRALQPNAPPDTIRAKLAEIIATF